MGEFKHKTAHQFSGKYMFLSTKVVFFVVRRGLSALKLLQRREVMDHEDTMNQNHVS